MHQFALVFAAIAIAHPAVAQEINGTNCDLQAAPADAGEIFFVVGKVSATGRVYPRLSSIPSNYNGCQVLWSSINGSPVFRSVTLLKEGRVVAVNPLPDGIPLCGAGERAANTGCTSRKTTLQVSYPPGCAARVVESKKVPEDCTKAFQAEFRLNDQIDD